MRLLAEPAIPASDPRYQRQYQYQYQYQHHTPVQQCPNPPVAAPHTISHGVVDPATLYGIISRTTTNIDGLARTAEIHAKDIDGLARTAEIHAKAFDSIRATAEADRENARILERRVEAGEIRLGNAESRLDQIEHQLDEQRRRNRATDVRLTINRAHRQEYQSWKSNLGPRLDEA